MIGFLQTIGNVLASRGWLPEPTEGFVKAVNLDDAIKNFQQHHGLQTNRGLDDETVRAIMAPRICGLPDVLPQTMDAERLCKWPDGKIPYFVAAAFPGLTIDESYREFAAGVKPWADVANLQFIPVDSVAEARIVARIRRLDGPNGVLAQSELPCGGITQAKQDYDSSEAWNRSVMARLVVMHEVGHALGIGHIGSGNVMAPTYNGTLSAPQAGDIAEIVKRYGRSTPTPGPTPADDHPVINAQEKRIIVRAGWTIEVR